MPGRRGALTLIDADTVSLSNINRQLPALHSTAGRRKVEVLAERFRDINPDIRLTLRAEYVTPESVPTLLDGGFDFIVDAIDTIAPKVALLSEALHRRLPVISSMGAGAKTDITQIRFADLWQTYHCGLSKSVRTGLTRAGLKGRRLPVVFCTQQADRRALLSVEGERNKKNNRRHRELHARHLRLFSCPVRPGKTLKAKYFCEVKLIQKFDRTQKIKNLSIIDKVLDGSQRVGTERRLTRISFGDSHTRLETHQMVAGGQPDKTSCRTAGQRLFPKVEIATRHLIVVTSTQKKHGQRTQRTGRGKRIIGTFGSQIFLRQGLRQPGQQAVVESEGEVKRGLLKLQPAEVLPEYAGPAGTPTSLTEEFSRLPLYFRPENGENRYRQLSTDGGMKHRGKTVAAAGLQMCEDTAGTDKAVGCEGSRAEKEKKQEQDCPHTGSAGTDIHRKRLLRYFTG